MKYLQPLLSGVMSDDIRMMTEDILRYAKYRLPLKAFWHLRVPACIKRELREIAEFYDIDVLQALILNLSYEIGGAACISAAVADDSHEGYSLFRQLEWSLPDFVQSEPATHDNITFMQISGCAGIYDGKRGTEMISMNLSPDYFDSFNPFGTPASWVVREALHNRRCFMKDYLLNKAPAVIRPAWVLLVVPYAATVIRLQTNGKHILHKEVKFPETLMICNDWETDPEVRSSVEGWYRRNSSKLKPGLHKAKALPQSITNRSGILHSVTYTHEWSKS